PVCDEPVGGTSCDPVMLAVYALYVRAALVLANGRYPPARFCSWPRKMPDAIGFQPVYVPSGLRCSTERSPATSLPSWSTFTASVGMTCFTVGGAMVTTPELSR